MPSFPGGVGLMVGCPQAGRPVAADMIWVIANLHPPMNYEVRYQIIKGMPVAEARNAILEQAKKDRVKFVFFQGDDVGTPAHAIRQLIYLMEHNPNVAVMGGIYCHKGHPNAPLVFRGNGLGPYWDWKVGELFEVSGLGMDMTLIRMSVLDDLEPPYFKTVDAIDAMMDGVNKAEVWTEDLYFCSKVTSVVDAEGKQKWKIMADGSLIAKHFNPDGSFAELPLDCKPRRHAAVKMGDKKIIDLGCGTDKYKTPEGEVLGVDFREEVDPDYRCDIRQLPFATGEFDIVFSSHTLEHFCRSETTQVIEEWIRILKPNGELRLILPNIEWAARHIVNGEIDVDVMNVLYGMQTYDNNFHRMGFTPKILEQMLCLRGFRWFIWDFHNYHMLCRAWKERPSDWPENASSGEEGLAEKMNPAVTLKRKAEQKDVTVTHVPSTPAAAAADAAAEQK